MAYTYKDYEESQRVKELREKLDAAESAKPQYAESKWSQLSDDAINQIANKGEFKYDVNTDPLFQQYKQQYLSQGNKAMKDTIGKAAALTGGYGNSYALSAGQQAYNDYAGRVNERIPELYQAAMDKYNMEKNDLYKLQALYADRENQDYGRYRDSLSDYYAEQEMLNNQYNNERSFDYGKYSDNRDFDRNVFENDRNYDRSVFESDRNFNEDVRRNNRDYDEGVRQFNANFGENQRQFNANHELNTAKFNESVRQYNTSRSDSKAQSDREYQLALAKLAQGSSGSKSSGGSGTKTTTDKEAQYRADVGNYTQSPTDAMKQFSASIMTKQEFARHGGTTVDGRKVTNYSNYIDAMLLKWTDGGQLTEAEGDALSNIYINKGYIK